MSKTKKVVRRKRWQNKRSLQVGKIERGAIFVVVIMVTLMFAAYIFVGGTLPTKLPGLSNNLVVVIPPTLQPAKSNLQLETFSGATVTPVPPPPSAGPTSPQTALCQNGAINNEPDILVGYSPANGQTVSATGQIKVWVNDEGAPIIAPNEQLNPSTGAITSLGDTSAKAPDNYLWEPALYIAPQTAESGGTPHFPNAIKGQYNNNPNNKIDCDQTPASQIPTIPGMDPVPPGNTLGEKCTNEDIWNVNSLGLTPGTYTAEFVIHDGDEDRGVGCINITVQ